MENIKECIIDGCMNPADEHGDACRICNNNALAMSGLCKRATDLTVAMAQAVTILEQSLDKETAELDKTSYEERLLKVSQEAAQTIKPAAKRCRNCFKIVEQSEMFCSEQCAKIFNNSMREKLCES